jgi:hypothetical protein
MKQSEPGKATARRQRLAEALRANLKRRKGQQRLREPRPARPGDDVPAHPSSDDPAGESS